MAQESRREMPRGRAERKILSLAHHVDTRGSFDAAALFAFFPFDRRGKYRPKNSEAPAIFSAKLRKERAAEGAGARLRYVLEFNLAEDRLLIMKLSSSGGLLWGTRSDEQGRRVVDHVFGLANKIQELVDWKSSHPAEAEEVFCQLGRDAQNWFGTPPVSGSAEAVPGGAAAEMLRGEAGAPLLRDFLRRHCEQLSRQGGFEQLLGQFRGLSYVTGPRLEVAAIRQQAMTARYNFRQRLDLAELKGYLRAASRPPEFSTEGAGDPSRISSHSGEKSASEKCTGDERSRESQVWDAEWETMGRPGLRVTSPIFIPARAARSPRRRYSFKVYGSGLADYSCDTDEEGARAGVCFEAMIAGYLERPTAP